MRQQIKDTIIGTALVIVVLATIPSSLALMVWALGV
jgi:hypothetical protein